MSLKLTIFLLVQSLSIQRLVVLHNHRRPKLSVRESQQRYEDLYGHPDKKPLSSVW